MGKYSIEDFAFNGKYHNYCWNYSYNPNATIENGLANCTTMAIAFSYIHNLPYPVTRIGSASVWHRLLTNGWTYKPYGSVQIKKGDILEWVGNVHVATVIDIKEGEPYLGCSWYTGEHGVATIDGKYDTRDSIHSLEQLSDFMVSNYPYRFYHEATIYDESNLVGGLPDYVLVAPERFKPNGQDSSVDQIQVLTNEQYVRDGDSNIVGVADSGYFNVIGSKEEGNYTWYQIKKNAFIAGVKGRVIFIPASDEVEELRAEIKRLKDKLDKIQKEAQY